MLLLKVKLFITTIHLCCSLRCVLKPLFLLILIELK